jgi:hypothetical protein
MATGRPSGVPAAAQLGAGVANASCGETRSGAPSGLDATLLAARDTDTDIDLTSGGSEAAAGPLGSGAVRAVGELGGPVSRRPSVA